MLAGKPMLREGMWVMKLGMVLYKHQLNDEHLLFCKQMGCTHLIIHLVDYFHKEKDDAAGDNQPVGGSGGWGVTRNRTPWSYEEMAAIKAKVDAVGLVWEAIENLDPGFWFDILLDGPRKQEQVEGLKRLVADMGRLDIPILGYNFSIAGVASRITGPFARGGAESVGSPHQVDDTPIPVGMVWNMVYDPDNFGKKGNLPPITHEQLWGRLSWFLKEILPVAEKAGVRLALHPDDPPYQWVRGTPRLVYEIPMYQKMLDIAKSPANAIDCCVGTLCEMSDGSDIYAWLDKYASQNAIAYIHLRNVRGKIPDYRETFIDEGDLDIFRVLKILKKNHFQGVIIPDHTPLPAAPAPWLTGMAFALGYIRAMLQTVERAG